MGNERINESSEPTLHLCKNGKGDMIIMVSDGVTQAFSEAGKFLHSNGLSTAWILLMHRNWQTLC